MSEISVVKQCTEMAYGISVGGNVWKI